MTTLAIYNHACISQHQDAAAFNMKLNVPVYSYANIPSFPEVVECHSIDAHTVLYAGYPKVVYRHIST